MPYFCTDGTFDAAATGQLVTSVLSGIGLIVAAWAAMEARRAAVNALVVDSNNADRVKDRERRDSIPIAMMIQRELHEIGGLIASVPAIVRETLDRPAAADDVLLQLKSMAPRFRARSLERCATQLGCFEEETGRALGIAGALTDAFANMLDIPELPPRDQCIAVLNIICEQAPNYSAPVIAGARGLVAYSGAPLDPQALSDATQARADLTTRAAPPADQGPG